MLICKERFAAGSPVAEDNNSGIIDSLNHNRKTAQSEHSSNSKNSTAKKENFTSENSRASAELSLVDDQVDTDKLESKIEIEDHPIKDEEPKRKQSISSQVFGFTQYAADSPYPAASLNFASVLSNLVSPRERRDIIEDDKAKASTSSDPSIPPIHTISIKQESFSSDHPVSSQIDRNLGTDMEACPIKTEITTEEDFLINEEPPQEVLSGSLSKQSTASTALEHKNNRYKNKIFC